MFDPVWNEQAKARVEKMPEKALEVRERALSDLFYFAKLVNPGHVYGQIHEEVFYWLQDYTIFGSSDELSSNKLIMLPRAHLKSHMVSTWCAWIIARHPEITILYLSATAELALSQMYAIQNILAGDIFQRYFPEYIHPQEGKREKWSANEIMVDHEARYKEGVRDGTVKIAGLTTNTTGWHADIIIADDLVVPENAYTEGGRDLVLKKSSQFTSIRNAGGFTLACGTRYHPRDVYSSWKEQTYEVYDENEEKVDELPVWDIKEYAVEQEGVFLWPRSIRSDGKAFGFNKQILARIRGEYEDKTQFFAQYYNDPNDASSDRISRDKFQYYNPRLLKREGGKWFYNGYRLNVYAAVDFAFSLTRKADFTAIVVIGMDHQGNVFVLDIDRFKSDKILEYFQHIKELHSKWQFNKLRAEVSVAQKVLVNSIKDYVRKEGLTLSIDEHRPTHKDGRKEERIAAALEHRYDDLTVWHCEGGWTEILEEELVQSRPAHDDVKDALASAVEIAIPPSKPSGVAIQDFLNKNVKRSRFGGYRG